VRASRKALSLLLTTYYLLLYLLLTQGEVRASRKALSFSKREALLGTPPEL